MLDLPIGDVIKLFDASGVDEEVIIQLVEDMRDAFQLWVRHCMQCGCFTCPDEIYYASYKLRSKMYYKSTIVLSAHNSICETIPRYGNCHWTVLYNKNKMPETLYIKKQDTCVEMCDNDQYLCHSYSLAGASSSIQSWRCLHACFLCNKVHSQWHFNSIIWCSWWLTCVFTSRNTHLLNDATYKQMQKTVSQRVHKLCLL